MAEQIFNSRVQLKIDTHDNWVANQTLVLKDGEPAFDIVLVVDPTTSQYVPAVMMKVGDGVNTWGNLKYMYAPAADVYSWAKSETKPNYSADEIAGIDAKIADYVSEEMGIEVDTDTQYSIAKVSDYQYKLMSKSKGDTEFATEVAVIDIPDKTSDISALQALVGETSVATQIANAIVALDLANTYDAKGAADQALTDAKTYADKKVGSVTSGDNSVSIGGTATAPTVAVNISEAADNAISLEDDGLKVVIPDAAEYSIVRDADSGDYAAVYHLTKDGLDVGVAINIPKDMVVKSGSVVTNPEGQAAGTYIKLVLQNVTDPLFIDVGNLIEYVTSGSSAGDMIVVAVSDDHKVTATITDGSITKAKLETSVQTSLNKAETAVQPDDLNDLKNASHIHDNKVLLDTYTQTEANLADAVGKKHDHANKEELDKFATGDKAALDKAVADIATLNGSEGTAGSVKKAIADAKSALTAEINKKANDADLAAIAKSGNVNDLIQTSGDVIVFNCGSATVNI